MYGYKLKRAGDKYAHTIHNLVITLARWGVVGGGAGWPACITATMSHACTKAEREQ